MGFVVDWSSQEAGSIANVTSEKVQVLLEHALQMTSDSSLFCIQQAIETVTEKLPHNPEIRFYIADRSYRAPAGISHFVDRWSYFSATFKIYRNCSTSLSNRTVSLAFPGIFGIPFQVEQNIETSNLQLNLYTRLDGIVQEDNDTAQNADLPSRVNYILRTIHDVVRPTLSGATFTSLGDLTNNVVSLLMDHRDLFGDIIDVKNIRVKAQVKEHQNLVTQVAVRSARAPSNTEHTRGLEEDPPSGSEEDVTLKNRIFIALGSNMGERLQHIEDACREIDSEPEIRILRTSALYETAPMYVENQDRFLNGVCEVGSIIYEGRGWSTNWTRSRQLCSQ